MTFIIITWLKCFVSDEFHPEGTDSDDEETIEKDEAGLDEVIVNWYLIVGLWN